MSNFTPLVKFVVEFDGDTVEMSLRRLKRKALVDLSPYLSGGISEDGELVMSFDDQAQFSEAMAKVIPPSVVDFCGLVDADGNPVDIDTVVEEAYFQPLVGQIMGKLFAISKPTGEETKNSPAEPADSSRSESSATTRGSAGCHARRG